MGQRTAHPRLPNFFLAGAPKAGTTSLYHYLGQHPDVYVSPVKEPHYFASEIRPENFTANARRLQTAAVGVWEDYLRLFEGSGGEAALGEGSVCYLWSPSAPVRIAAEVPGARIILMLRDPAERAFSQYLQGLGNGAIRWSLREHIRRNQRHNGAGQLCEHYPFLEFGLYSESVCRYLRQFSASVWIGLYDDFCERPGEVCQSIFRFLDVDPSFAPALVARYQVAQVPRVRAAAWLKRRGYWQAAARRTPAALRPLIRKTLIRRPGQTRMSRADRSYLQDFYREDIQKLAGVLNRDLSAWLTDPLPV